MKKNKFVCGVVSPNTARCHNFFISFFEVFFSSFECFFLRLDCFVRARNFVFSAFLLSLLFGLALFPLLVVSFVLFLVLFFEWRRFYLINKDFEDNSVF